MVIIPARYDSTRFPGKPLSLLRGKTLIQHVYENSRGANLIDDIIVATDSEAIFEKVFSFGGKAVMTSKVHPSGTDRIAEVAASMDCDIVVNVQADEPLIQSQMIDDVILLLDDERASIGTLVKKIADLKEIANPNVVKVVFDEEGFALYFSRSPIPYHRDEWKYINISAVDSQGKEHPLPNPPPSRGREGVGGRLRTPNAGLLVFKHVGIYSYRREALLALSKMEPTELEKIEKLEQLRAIEKGMRIKTKETFIETYGVDTPEDLERIEKCLSTSL